MKTLKDFYIVVTKQNHEQIKELLPNYNYGLNKTIYFNFDDVNSYSLRDRYNVERISLSKLKRYIDNTPTREGFKKAQNASKIYKYKYEQCKKESEELLYRNERLQYNLDNLRSEREQLTSIAKKDINLGNKTLIEWVSELYNVCLDYDRLNSEKVDLESELRVKERVNNELIKDNTILEKELRKYKTVAMCSLLLTLLALGLWF